MKRYYELYARFSLVTDKGAKNSNIAALADTVEACDGTTHKVQDYGERALAQPPSTIKYLQSHTWDVCLYIDLPPEKVGDLKKLLRMRISELIRFIVTEVEEDSGSGFDPDSSPPSGTGGAKPPAQGISPGPWSESLSKA